MANHTFPNREVLRSIVQSAIGPLCDVQWDYHPEDFQGFSGLDDTGEPLPGMPLTKPAIDPSGSGGACKVTLAIQQWVDRGWDDTRRSFGLSATEAAGTAPPTIAFVATLTDPEWGFREDKILPDIRVRVALGGLLGVWTGEYSLDGGTTWTSFTSAATVTLLDDTSNPIGVDLAISVGNASLNNTWKCTPIQTLLQVGLRHFTLNIKVESEADAFAIAERIRTYWYFKSTIAALPDNYMAIRSVGETQRFDAVWDNKTIRAAMLDVFLTYSLEIVDEAGETGSVVPNNWIQTATPLTFEDI